MVSRNPHGRMRHDDRRALVVTVVSIHRDNLRLLAHISNPHEGGSIDQMGDGNSCGVVSSGIWNRVTIMTHPLPKPQDDRAVKVQANGEIVGKQYEFEGISYTVQLQAVSEQGGVFKYVNFVLGNEDDFHWWLDTLNSLEVKPKESK